jgi:putative addiction module component (TIGR02574 family)
MVDIKEIRKLSVEERIVLVESIWDSIAEDTNPEGLAIPEAERQEILKRYNDFKGGNQKTYSWDEVKSYALEP